MPHIDLRTVILLAGFMTALMAVVLFFVTRSFPQRIRGIGHWAGGTLVGVFSGLLFGLRGLIPDALSVLLASLLLYTALSLWLSGTELFYQRQPSWRFQALVSGVGLGLLTWFLLVQPDTNARLAVAGLSLPLFYGRQLLVVFRYGRPGFISRFFCLVLLAQIGVLLLRGSSALVPGLGSDFLEQTPIQVIYLTAYPICTLMITVGYVLLATDRLRGELEYLSSHDSLTQILNRRAFVEVCEWEMARARRHGRALCLLMLDLDFFKKINDTYGHQAGDLVLQGFVQRVGAVLRRGEHFGRYGGEEFVVLLPDADLEQARQVAERIRLTTAEGPAQLPPVTVSIGVAALEAADTNLDCLLSRADNAMYLAKANGRNRIEVAAAGTREEGAGVSPAVPAP